MKRLIVRTNKGLGDNIYIRPVLRWLPKVDLYLETPWPQAYCGLDVKFLKPDLVKLRTQRENLRGDFKWENVGTYIPNITVNYDLGNGSITENYCRILLGQQPSWFDKKMVIDSEHINKALAFVRERTTKKLCLIRPNTIRSEWACPARNPKHEYLQRFIDQYKDKFYIISIASLASGHEMYHGGALKNVDLEITKDLSIEMVFGLFAISDIIVTSPSFWLPLASSLEKNAVVLYGAHFPHKTLHDQRIKDKYISVVEPKPFDLCFREKTDAFKSIDENILDAAFKEAVDRC